MMTNLKNALFADSLLTDYDNQLHFRASDLLPNMTKQQLLRQDKAKSYYKHLLTTLNAIC